MERKTFDDRKLGGENMFQRAENQTFKQPLNMIL